MVVGVWEKWFYASSLLRVLHFFFHFFLHKESVKGEAVVKTTSVESKSRSSHWWIVSNSRPRTSWDRDQDRKNIDHVSHYVLGRFHTDSSVDSVRFRGEVDTLLSEPNIGNKHLTPEGVACRPPPALVIYIKLQQNTTKSLFLRITRPDAGLCLAHTDRKMNTYTADSTGTIHNALFFGSFLVVGSDHVLHLKRTEPSFTWKRTETPRFQADQSLFVWSAPEFEWVRMNSVALRLCHGDLSCLVYIRFSHSLGVFCGRKVLTHDFVLSSTTWEIPRCSSSSCRCL